MLTLYANPVSTASRPVLLFVAEKDLPVQLQLVDLMSGEHKGDAYAAINPSKMVPALADGDFRMSESSAILKYLASRFGAPEYPEQLERRAKVDEAMDWFNTQFYRDFGYGLLYPQVFPHHKRRSDEAHAAHVEWGKGKTQAWLSIFDRNILGKNDFVANNAISIADYLGAGFLAAGELIGCTYAGFPNVQRWLGNMKKLKSWESVHQAMHGFAGSLKDKEFERV
jgi:glutathione S-transferase